MGDVIHLRLAGHMDGKPESKDTAEQKPVRDCKDCTYCGNEICSWMRRYYDCAMSGEGRG
jgi:hypothetical protein